MCNMQKNTSRSLASSRFLQVQLVRFILFWSPWFIKITTIRLLALVGYEIIIANKRPRASLAMYLQRRSKVLRHLTWYYYCFFLPSFLPSFPNNVEARWAQRCFFFTQDGYRYLLCYTVDFALTETSTKRTPRVSPRLSLLPLFDFL